jgi:sec-independent protein translocase protein TatB
MTFFFETIENRVMQCYYTVFLFPKTLTLLTVAIHHGVVIFSIFAFRNQAIMTLLFFDFGTGEILIIMLVLFVVLGPQKLPEVARTIGKTINEMKRASAGFKNEINKEIDRIERDTTIKDINLDGKKSNQTEKKSRALDDSVAQGSIQPPENRDLKNESINPSN